METNNNRNVSMWNTSAISLNTGYYYYDMASVAQYCSYFVFHILPFIVWMNNYLLNHHLFDGM